MRKSKATRSSAADERTSRTGKSSASQEAYDVASKSKLVTKRRVHAGKVNRPVQLNIFEYAASIGIALLPEAS